MPVANPYASMWFEGVADSSEPFRRDLRDTFQHTVIIFNVFPWPIGEPLADVSMARPDVEPVLGLRVRCLLRVLQLEGGVPALLDRVGRRLPLCQSVDESRSIT